MKTKEKCPVCKNSSFQVYLDVKDHMISKEEFTIVKCRDCGFRFTNPIPSIERIGEYYKSENYISHSSNKRGLINFVYNIVRRYTLKQKVKWVKHETNGIDLLDIGSGTGHFLKVANESGFNGFGIEPDADAREFAHQVNEVRSSDQKELYTISKDRYDVVTMWHVLEHVYDLDTDLKKIHEILKIDGYLIIAVPNAESYDAEYYKEHWAAYDLPRHLYHFTKNDLAKLMLDYNFRLKKVIPMKFDAFYISMLSEKYKKRFFLFGFFIGLLSNFKAKSRGYSSQVYIFEKTY